MYLCIKEYMSWNSDSNFLLGENSWTSPLTSTKQAWGCIHICHQYKDTAFIWIQHKKILIALPQRSSWSHPRIFLRILINLWSYELIQIHPNKDTNCWCCWSTICIHRSMNLIVLVGHTPRQHIYGFLNSTLETSWSWTRGVAFAFLAFSFLALELRGGMIKLERRVRVELDHTLHMIRVTRKCSFPKTLCKLALIRCGALHTHEKDST